MIGKLREVLRQTPTVVWVAIAVTTVIRLLLVSRGQFWMADEARYYLCLEFWDSLSELHPRKSITYIYYAKGRPGQIALYLPVAGMQWLTMRVTGLDWLSSAWIPTLMTVSCAAANMILVHRLALKVANHACIAVSSAVVYGFCAPTLYYPQFLLPYVTAQTLVLMSLCLLPSDVHKSKRRFLACGALFGMAFATYPGYYDQAIFVAVLALFVWRRFGVRELLTLLWVPLGVVLVVGGWEVLSRAGWGPYYFESLGRLKGLIKQGDFSENWCYVGVFLWDVDRLFAVVSAVGLSVTLVTAGKRIRHNAGTWALIVGLLTWYGMQLFNGVLERNVLYGRLVYAVVPYLSILAGVGCYKMFGSKASVFRWQIGGIALLSVWSAWNLSSFFDVTGPKHFKKQFFDRYPQYDLEAFASSFHGTNLMSDDYDELDRRLVDEMQRRRDAQECVVLVNEAVFYPVTGISQPDRMYIIARARHPMNLHALHYEAAFDPIERRIVRTQEIELMLIECPRNDVDAWYAQWGGCKRRP